MNGELDYLSVGLSLWGIIQQFIKFHSIHSTIYSFPTMLNTENNIRTFVFLFAICQCLYSPLPTANSKTYVTDSQHRHYIDGLVQDCSISIDDTLEILQSCIKPSTYPPPFLRVTPPIHHDIITSHPETEWLAVFQCNFDGHELLSDKGSVTVPWVRPRHVK